ncbi:hypothetical protein FRUB_02742 [Fimbriiglobus ruber]|uniref:Uncharacterized protein n=1 Tax=Fimbriiglobus ruber TaxID=1908690 RepID=A0A225DPX4_9BACT|nr:hypothetical protein FRUB_02742 [Fimbriiglobus ruber]
MNRTSKRKSPATGRLRNLITGRADQQAKIAAADRFRPVDFSPPRR